MARKKKQTLLEFKAWLEGVEELQPDNWAPNAQQWKLIREKIKGIAIEQVVKAPKSKKVEPNKQLPRFVPSPASTGIPPPNVEMTPEAKQMLQPVAGTKLQTPNIDTADGNYESSFT